MAPLSLQEISDRFEISDLLTRYTRAIDTKDFELLDTCFTPDAFVDYTSSGGVKGHYPEVRAWLAKALAPFPAMMHFVGNSSIELEGNEARTRTYVINPMAVQADGGIRHAFTVCAHYVDKLVRTAEGWRIAERIEEQVIFEGALPERLEIPE
jgi:3-phenylpropionate/cinnamic acid dioxygenase small subunit